jgi:xanthine dehydrogenase accessory factor
MKMNSADRSRSGEPRLFGEIVRLQEAGRPAVLATPLWSRGSVPLREHSRLLLRDDGSFFGTIGGGSLEAQVLAAGRAVMSSDAARVLEFNLSQAEAAESGMICGGQCAVLLESITPEFAPDVFRAAARAEATGESLVLITLLVPEDRGPRFALTSTGVVIGVTDDSSLGEILRALAKEALVEGRPRLVEEPVRAHLDPVLPRPRLCLFGAGHIAVVLAHMAGLAGFRVVVTDDREEFANRERFPSAEEVLAASVPEAFAGLSIDEHSYVVAVTRGHRLDEEVVARALGTPARYVGMIGSRRKVATTLTRLRERGISEEEIARLHAPIGLDIGAQTVEEIAVSILAQLIAVRRKSS